MPVAARPVELDHVAHAVDHWRDIWDRYGFDLGARWMSGGPNRGFAPAQVRFRGGSRIEMLMPWDVHHDDFLARFLERNGPGAHHLTFKVHDLRAALDHARAAGFEPIGIELSDPQWMEAFLHPKQAGGVVVQMAQTSLKTGEGTGWDVPPPDGFPTGRRPRRDGSGPIAPSRLDSVVHAVADPGLGRALFVDLLRGTVVAGGHQGAVGWTDISWDGPLDLRLLWPHARGMTDATTGRPVTQTTSEDERARRLAAWLGGRPGRVHHLEVRVDDPGGVPDAVPMSDPLSRLGSTEGRHWELPAEANHGLRLALIDTAASDGRAAVGSSDPTTPR